ncbi:Alpha/Beta hydrolase protein [Xylariales sp. PMI_506]|nr:Alpha/Beta hydrolase protein [Xylariales sp. PMI_506]
MADLPHVAGFFGTASRQTFFLGAVCFSTGILLSQWLQRPSRRWLPTFSPKSVVDALPEVEVSGLPYPPDVLPGGRDVATPYGSIRVFEWGPEDGDKALFLHGISTPTISLGDLGHELVSKGYRVMLFDLFGRGYSDAPNDVAYDSRLYTTQILLVLASSQLPWTQFHLIGYSLGGCLAVSFTRYFSHRVISLSMITGGGLIRPHHVGWQSKLLYSSGILPEGLVKFLVRRRIRPAADPPKTANGADIIAAETKVAKPGNGDANGGQGFDSAAISRYRPTTSVSSVVTWQIDHHEGFVGAFLSTIRNAPIYAPQEDWRALSSELAQRRTAVERKPAGLVKGRVLLILGKQDPVIIPSEIIEDAEEVLGIEGVEYTILDVGHELPITRSSEAASCIDTFIRQ